jgi:hypothetical protein
VVSSITIIDCRALIVLGSQRSPGPGLELSQVNWRGTV